MQAPTTTGLGLDPTAYLGQAQHHPLILDATLQPNTNHMLTGVYTHSALASAAACHSTQVQINATIISLLQSGLSLAQISNWLQQNTHTSQFSLAEPLVPFSTALSMNALASEMNILKLDATKVFEGFTPCQPHTSTTGMSEPLKKPPIEAKVHQLAPLADANTAPASDKAANNSTASPTRLKELVQESSLALGANQFTPHMKPVFTIGTRKPDNNKKRTRKSQDPSQRPMKFMYCSPLLESTEKLEVSTNLPSPPKRPRKPETAPRKKLFKVRFKNIDPNETPAMKQDHKKGDKEAAAAAAAWQINV